MNSKSKGNLMRCFGVSGCWMPGAGCRLPDAGSRVLKGAVISLDAMVALTFVLFAMIIIASQSYNTRAPEGVYLKQLTLDIITVLEKTGRIDMALDGNSSAVQEVLEATPKLACMKIYVINSAGSTVTTMVKSDCNETTDLDMQVSARSLLYQNERYILKTESWLRKEPG